MAIAPGQLFKLPAGYPAMSAGSVWVHGFALTFANPILDELDDYEDYQVGRSPDLNLYERQVIPTFEPTGGSLCPAWAYVMSLEKAQNLGGLLLPDGYWYK